MRIAVRSISTALWQTRNVVFFMAVIAMNYTLSRIDVVDFLFVAAAFLSIAVNQTIRISFLIFLSLLVGWTFFFYIATIPFLNEPAVVREIVNKTYIVALGLIAAYVSMSWGPRQYQQFIYVYIVSATIAATLGIIGFVFGVDILLWDGRARGFIDDPNMFGSFLLPAIIGCIYLLSRGIGRRYVLLATTLILTLGVLLSFSRAAVVGLAVCAVGYIAFLNRANIMRLIGYIAGFVVIGGVLVGIAFVTLPNFSEKFFDRATLAKSYDLGREGRYARIERSVPIILDNPRGLGVIQDLKFWPEPIHNSVLGSFLNYGWGGGITWLVLIFMTIGLSIWNYLSTRSPIAVVLLVGFLATFLGTLLHQGEHWRHLWLWMGLVWGFNTWNFTNVPSVGVARRALLARAAPRPA